MLINGDSLEYLKSMKDESVDCIITDPPYGLLKHKIETNINIDLFFKECFRVLKKDSFIVFFGMQPTLSYWNVKALESGFKYKNEVIWYKKDGSPLLDMLRLHENISIFVKGKKKFNDAKLDYIETNENLSEFVNIDTIKRMNSFLKEILNNKEKLKKIIDFELSGGVKVPLTNKNTSANEFVNTGNLKDPERYINCYKTVFKGCKARSVVGFRTHNKQKSNKDSHNIKHPTVKPIQLMEYLISLTTKENDTIIDPFMGSGTTCIACVNLDRKYIGIELDEGYFKIAENRINQAIKVKKERLV